MKPFIRALGTHNLSALTYRAREAETTGPGEFDPVAVTAALNAALLNSSDRTDFLHEAITLVTNGLGVHQLLDLTVMAVSERMLRFREADDLDLSDDFGWLDMSHGLTFANAARWQWDAAPGPDTLRQALFALWLAHWTGRHEWHTDIGQRHVPTVGDIETASSNLIHASLTDGSGSFIVAAHAIKTSVAARDEARRTGSLLPLQATHRFVHARKMERFVARSVTEATEFLTGKKSRDD
jgi:hypothetical protein